MQHAESRGARLRVYHGGLFPQPRGPIRFHRPSNDPDDDSHIITFSGEKSKREQDNLYELSIDRMLLKSKDRPKIDGLPTPSVELSTGMCKQIGNFAAQQVSSVSCNAADGNGRKYEFQFESDGSPIKVRMIRAADTDVEEQRTKVLAAHMEQLKCRHRPLFRAFCPETAPPSFFNAWKNSGCDYRQLVGSCWVWRGLLAGYASIAGFWSDPG